MFCEIVWIERGCHIELIITSWMPYVGKLASACSFQNEVYEKWHINCPHFKLIEVPIIFWIYRQSLMGKTVGRSSIVSHPDIIAGIRESKSLGLVWLIWDPLSHVPILTMYHQHGWLVNIDIWSWIIKLSWNPVERQHISVRGFQSILLCCIAMCKAIFLEASECVLVCHGLWNGQGHSYSTFHI